MAMVERQALVEFVASFLVDQRKAGFEGVRRASRIAQLLASVWRQAGPGTRSRQGWGWTGIDPAVASQPAGRGPLPAHLAAPDPERSGNPHLVAGADGRQAGPPRRAGSAPCAGAVADDRARIGALALTRVADLDLDPERVVGARDHGPTIRIPAEEGRKMSAAERREGADLVLPLSRLAVMLFRRALDECSDGMHVFEGGGRRARAEHSLSGMGAAGRRKGRAGRHRRSRSAAHHADRARRARPQRRLRRRGARWSVTRSATRLPAHTIEVVGSPRLRPLANAWGERLEAIVKPPAPVRRLPLRGRKRV